MTPQQQSVIDKVRKLLALADEEGGGTPAERDLAAQKAADLMTRHDLDLIDLAAEDVRDEVGQEQEVVEGMTAQWRGVLRGRVAVAMGGDWFYTRDSRTRVRYSYVGRPETREFVRVLTDTLIPWLEIEANAALAKAEGRGTRTICTRCDGAGETRRLKGGGYTADLHVCPTCDGSGEVPLSSRVFLREFYDAASRRIAGRLAATRRKSANDAGGKGTGTALVKHDKAAIDRYYEQAGIKLYAARGGNTGGSGDARDAGREAGDRANIAPTRGVSRGRGALPAGSPS